ncbi:MAG TPA: site-2 protease family protein [Euzebya sp.]|nr:site-2 protease family protein [Euzebya sp.]
MFVVLFIGVILGAIMLHEFGHFVTAKAFGMKVTQFFVGFGPTLWSTPKGETEYGVKGIPAGGYVRIVGMNPWEETDPADDGRLFYQQKPWKRLIVLSAGSFTHLILAIALLFGALAFIGLPTGEATNMLRTISADSPAAITGLQAGDEIVAVDGQPTSTFEEVRDLVTGRFGDAIELTVMREGHEVVVDAVLDVPHPDPESSGDGFLGVSPVVEEVPLGIYEGARATFSGPLSIWSLTDATVDGLRQVFSLEGLGRFFGSVNDEGPRAQDSITSLVGAAQITSEFGNQGDIFAVLLVLAQLNLVLGLLNMLPLPPLDGGHIAVMAVEETVNRARRLRVRPSAERQPERFHLNPNVVTPIALAVIAFFIVLSGTALYLDIVNPASQLVQ